MRRRSSFTALGFICAIAISVAAHAATVNFTADLSGANERPTPNDSTATGTMTGTLTGDAGLFVFTYEITYEGLSGPATVGHIHDAILPEPTPPFTERFGAPVHDLDSLDSPIQGDWTYLDASQPLTDEHAANLIAGRMYVNIHTDLFPDGEIRGQLLAVEEPPTEPPTEPPPGGVIPLPAPIVMGLFGLGAAGVGAWKRRRVV
jgi:hypothetical protein